MTERLLPLADDRAAFDEDLITKRESDNLSGVNLGNILAGRP